MRHAKILYLSLALLFSASLCLAESIYQDYFRLPYNVSANLHKNQEIDIFFNSTESDLMLPGAGLSSNIFYRFNQEVDPLEAFNRGAFAINGFLIPYVLQPISWTLSAIIPKYGREGISRMDVNIQMPTRLINSLLQAKFEKAGIVLARFCVNTTVGIVGFYDVADPWFGLKPYNTNFGATFKYWGIGPGFYIVMPVEGSTSLRDGIGMIGDYWTNPLTYIPPYTLLNPISWGIKTFFGVNKMSLNINGFEKVYDTNYDAYDFTKQIWFFMERQPEPEDNVE